MIIPLARHEKDWWDLLPDLASLPSESEIILALSHDAEPLTLPQIQIGQNIRQVREGDGRGPQMNAAVRAAKGDLLWFLHADSRLHSDTIAALLRRAAEYPGRLLYGDLAFLADATPLMKLNEIGGWFRSHLLGMPFGDQGLCISKKLFHAVGGYPEDLHYGEDHVFVWRARQQGIRIQPIGAPVFTSARKYRERGWIRTTARHLWLTLRQAWPEWCKLLTGGKPT